MSKLSNAIVKESFEAFLNKGLKSIDEGFNSIGDSVIKSIGDSLLLKALRDEIKYESESTSKYQGDNGGSLGDFKIDWDSKLSQDILLRKKDESGEETIVSALLDHLPLVEYKDYLPWRVMMKVCIKKPGLNSILQFDCHAVSHAFGKSACQLHNVYCIQSASKLQTPYGAYLYRNQNLCVELHKYLEARGIDESLTNFLVLHLHKKEQDRYLEWLQKLEATIADKK